MRVVRIHALWLSCNPLSTPSILELLLELRPKQMKKKIDEYFTKVGVKKCLEPNYREIPIIGHKDESREKKRKLMKISFTK